MSNITRISAAAALIFFTLPLAACEDPELLDEVEVEVEDMGDPLGPRTGAVVASADRHWYSTMVYNNPSVLQAMFQYYKDTYQEPTFDVTEDSADYPFAWAETGCGVDIAGLDELRSEHVSTELDWLRTLWYHYIWGEDPIEMAEAMSNAIAWQASRSASPAGPTRAWLAGWSTSSTTRPCFSPWPRASASSISNERRRRPWRSEQWAPAPHPSDDYSHNNIIVIMSGSFASLSLR